ncbi:MAG: oxygen-dependent coproporphyrinogen oxidase [Bacteroidota bacterium]
MCQALEQADGQAFQEDHWERPGGGGGRTRVIEGQHIEKGGVNFSAVHGPMPTPIAQSLDLGNVNFFATGVSIVLHPRSPRVPIIHMNVRYFETDAGHWWFGGGIDLTPHYIVAEDARDFHVALREVCDRHHPTYYPEFKKWADDYFYLRHREETRGVGGIFFDRLDGKDGFTKAQRFAFVQDVGRLFAPIYVQLLERNRDLPYDDAQKAWQYLRRGRYVEFNLVWDRGTKFGLETNGRTESILMSLPPMANWTYNHRPAEGSEEAKTLAQLKKGIDWIN